MLGSVIRFWYHGKQRTVLVLSFDSHSVYGIQVNDLTAQEFITLWQIYSEMVSQPGTFPEDSWEAISGYLTHSMTSGYRHFHRRDMETFTRVM